MKRRGLMGLWLLAAGATLWAASAAGGSALVGTVGGGAENPTGSGVAPAPRQTVGSASRQTVTPAPTGVFNGYSRASGTIWIGDYAYTLHPRLRVIGHGSKMGVVSAIKEGERVEYLTELNPDRPYEPYIVEIRRK